MVSPNVPRTRRTASLQSRMSHALSLSVVIPALNEGASIAVTLHSLQSWRKRGVEVIVADGGSSDETCARARPLADRIITAPRGRARQMNAGFQASHGDVILFLHADSLPPTMGDAHIAHALEDLEKLWGRFDVNITGKPFMLRVVAWFMNHRSRLSGIATGDQGIFVRRKTFERIGGFADIPLMEDVEICKRLNALCKPACLKSRITTSGRRWEAHGVWRTIFLMWKLRWMYSRGSTPESLAAMYRSKGK
jgi:rSAM/selenodomain-associated transferase 2